MSEPRNCGEATNNQYCEFLYFDCWFSVPFVVLLTVFKHAEIGIEEIKLLLSYFWPLH